MAEEKLVEKLSLQSSIVHQVAVQLVDTTASIVERLGGSRLLCQTDLQQFLQHEEDYTALLTKYANTQFQEVRTDAILLVRVFGANQVPLDIKRFKIGINKV